MAKKKNNELISSLLYIIVGVLLVIFRNEALDIAMNIAGIIFIVSGIIDLCRRNLISGAVSLIIGIAILVLAKFAIEIVLIVLGVMLAVKGLFALIDVFKKSRKNALEIVFPILTIVLGVLLALGKVLPILVAITGVLLAIDGILGLIGSLKK